MTKDRVLVQLIATDPERAQEVVLAELESDDYDMDVVDAMIFCAADKAPRDLEGGLAIWKPCVKVRVFSAEELRSCLHVSAEVIRRIALASAALDFDPYPAIVPVDEGDDLNWEGKELRTCPELVVVFVGNSPSTHEELVLSTVECLWYTFENLRVAAAGVIALATLQVEEDLALWEPELGVRLSSGRGIRPELYLSAELIQTMASCGVTLDFDPYVH